MTDDAGGRKPSGRARSSSGARTPSEPSQARSEFDFIKQLRRRTPSGKATARDGGSSLLCGIGDDAAVISQRAGLDTVITADLLVEDIDFRRATTPPRLLGHRALAVSLSDIAAMGARPRWALVSIGLPSDVWESPFLGQFYEGFRELGDAHAVALVGGDVSRTPERIVCDSIVVGEATHGRAVLRSGAQPGDQIFVTGALGGAAAGLQLLEAGARRTESAALKTRRTRTASRAREQLMLRQLRPVPRVAWGLLLGERRLASAMIDLSDGLSSDLAHLCRESRVGALIEAARLPLDPSLAPAGTQDRDALACALDGGEDFELLFTVPARVAARLPAEVGGIGVSRIGEVTDEAGKVRLLRDGRRTLLRPAGFQHFRRPRRAR